LLGKPVILTDFSGTLRRRAPRYDGVRQAMTPAQTRLVSRRVALGAVTSLAVAACGDAAPAASSAVASKPSGPAPTTAVATSAAASTPPAAPSPTTAAMEKELVIYSARREALMMPTVEAFQKKTGVKVSVKSGGSAELRELVAQEGAATKADIFFTTDWVDAELLRRKNLLSPHVSPLTEGVPAEFRAADGAWTGVIARSRNILINTNLVKREDYPASVFDLADPKWKGKVAASTLRDGVPIWLASLILLKGEAATLEFFTTLIKQNGMKVFGGGSEVTAAVSQGEFAAGFINHYYYVPKKREGAPIDLVYPDQGAGQIGTLVIPLAVAATKHAPRPVVAKAFIDFVLTPEGAAPMMTMEGEMPLRPDVPLGDHGAPGILRMHEIKRTAPFDVDKLIAARDRAIEIFTPLFT
jgi:iron(III) transport system substrate-binding protein